MSSASSAVTYTSVYTDSEPGRVFWGADEDISDEASLQVARPEHPPTPIEYHLDGDDEPSDDDTDDDDADDYDEEPFEDDEEERSN
ncbi:hypothetical protein Tco_0262564 [Tanacetum coccineum]